MYSWEAATIDDYKPLDDSKGWLTCPTCGELPRTWRFDNGVFARCRCRHKYDLPPARAESIMSVHSRTGNTAEYNRDDLRVAWNLFASTGRDQTLPEGRW